MMNERNRIVACIPQLTSTIMEQLSSEEESGSSNSDEEEIIVLLSLVRRKRRRRNLQRPVRIQFYIERVVPNYSAREFQSHFRVTRDAYETLLRTVSPSLSRQSTVGRCTINVEKQLLSVLWLLATPDSYRSVGERFDMGKASLAASFVRVVNALNAKAQQIIKWPSHAEVRRIERMFYRMANVPNVIGCIDGTYVPIKAPKENAESYVTRKCNFAITLQAVCDSTLKYVDIFVGYPGSVSDTRIFRNSDLYVNVQTNKNLYFPENTFIIGDKAYPSLSWCVAPYIDRGNLTPQMRHFNHVISQTRQTIERSFALLFGRFRRLKYLDMNRTDLIPATILAACVLHNICLDYNDLLIEDYIRDGAAALQNNEDIENLPQDREQIIEGRDRRDELCRLLYNQREQ
jgi:hypothetical protein